MNRREFSALFPMLIAAPALAPTAQAQSAAAPAQLPKLVSGLYPPGPASAAPTAPRISNRFLLGMLPDNIRLESHTTHLAPGAPPEAIGHHKHSELWFMREGEATLMTAGATHTLKPGDMGVCIAGDEHFITNASKTEPASYFVVAVGPPE